MPGPVEENNINLDIGSDRQLLIDDLLLDPDQSSSVTRTLNQPREIRRVLKPEHSWEVLGIQGYGTLIEDAGELKLYYLAMGMEVKAMLCLATSTDGLNWKKPMLGLVEYQGSKQNNILPIDAMEGSVFIDPNAAPDKRYKLVHNRNWPDIKTAGIYIAYSGDGINWTIPEERVFPFCPDSEPVAFWDDRISKYVIYFRTWNPGRGVGRVETDNITAPWPYDKSVESYYIWGEDSIPATSKEVQNVLLRDEQDPENLHLYTNAAIKYPFAPNMYFAFPSAYLHYDSPEWEAMAVSVSDGTFETQLAASRDGVSWERIRQSYVPAGFHDGLNLRMISMLLGMTRRGPSLYQYFAGFARTHGQHHVWREDARCAEEWSKRDLGGIYIAVQRMDGFLSMDAAYTGGTLVTKPFVFSGSRLSLNINTSGSGKARIGILAANSGVCLYFCAIVMNFEYWCRISKCE